jgi:N-acetylglucosamine-6-sulfatase
MGEARRRAGLSGSTRRWALVTAAVGLLLTAILAANAVRAAPCEVRVQAAVQRPNVVIVLFDDLDVALAETIPEWQELAATGVTFSKAFVTTPLCCPSRVSLLTGQLARNHGVHRNEGPTGGHQRARELGVERCTLPVWLQRAGYETALVGKYLNGYGHESAADDLPPGWDHWTALWRRELYDDYFLNVDGEVQTPGRYQTDVLADAAVDTIQAAEAPFFALITPHTPHRPYSPAERHQDAPTNGYPLPDRYRLMLSGIDLLRRVLATVPENTFVIVTSDNGYHLGGSQDNSRPQDPDPGVPRGKAEGKSRPWDSDTRVPMFITGPGIDAGLSIQRLVANIDLAPTIAEWAGIEPRDVDGRSLVPLLRGDDTDWRDHLTLEKVGAWEARRTDTTLTVRWASGRTVTREAP